MGLNDYCGIFVAAVGEGEADFVAVGGAHYLVAVFGALGNVTVVFEGGGYFGAVGLFDEDGGYVDGVGFYFFGGFGSLGEEG